MHDPCASAARTDRGFFGGGDPGEGADGPDSECEFAGHCWQDAGGGMEICAVCEAERLDPLDPGRLPDTKDGQ